jgi:hypothetical protein
MENSIFFSKKLKKKDSFLIFRIFFFEFVEFIKNRIKYREFMIEFSSFLRKNEIKLYILFRLRYILFRFRLYIYCQNKQDPSCCLYQTPSEVCIPLG